MGVLVLDPTRGKKRSRNSMMPEMGRLIREQERLKKQVQKKRGLHTRAGLTSIKLTPGELARRMEEEKRLKAQTERISRQSEAEKKRVLGARTRGKAVSGLDRAKFGREKRWTGKWNRRRAKLDASARKYELKVRRKIK